MYELRWFFSGSDSGAAQEWLNGLATDRPDEERGREEVYVRYRADIGIKISRGGLELKERTEPPKRFVLAGGVVGTIEYWEKVEWKYATTAKSPDEDPVYQAFAVHTAARDRVVTKKTRFLRKFEVRSNAFIPVPKSARPDVAFLIEVTNVEVKGGTPWWTVQFELLADKAAADPEAFRRAVDWALGQKWPSLAVLRESNSWGYPRLVDTIVGGR